MICQRPTKNDDKNYQMLLKAFAEAGPKDKAFQSLIDELKMSSPSKAVKEMTQCAMRGGNNSAMTTGYTNTSAMRGTKWASTTWGGSLSPVEESNAQQVETAVEEEESAAAAAPSAKSPEQPSRKKCYAVAMTQLAAGMVGGSYAAATIGTSVLFPFLMRAGGNPCDGYMDQAVSGFASLWNESYSCEAREAEFATLVQNILLVVSGLLGYNWRRVLFKSPKIMGLTLKYLATRQCPDRFPPFSLDQYKEAVSEALGPAQDMGAASKTAAKAAPAKKGTASAAAAPAAAASSKAAPAPAPASSAAAPAASEAANFADPQDVVPTRRSARLRKGGKKGKHTKKRHHKKHSKHQSKKHGKSRSRKHMRKTKRGGSCGCGM